MHVTTSSHSEGVIEEMRFDFGPWSLGSFLAATGDKAVAAILMDDGAAGAISRYRWRAQGKQKRKLINREGVA